MTSPDLRNVVWVKTLLTKKNILKIYRHIRPKKVKYPIPEIPDDSENKSGMDWVLPKIIGSGPDHRPTAERMPLKSIEKQMSNKDIKFCRIITECGR